jgi:hypothetical protein
MSVPHDRTLDASYCRVRPKSAEGANLFHRLSSGSENSTLAGGPKTGVHFSSAGAHERQSCGGRLL